LIIYQAPIDPASLQFGQRSDQASIERLRKQYYLDQPLGYQVLRYLEDLSPLQRINVQSERIQLYQYTEMFQLGQWRWILKIPYLRKSYINGEDVSSLIGDALPGTLWLGFSALLVAVFLGVLLGTFAAVYQNSILDQLILNITTLFYSIPSYISAILFALVFAFYLGDWTGLPLQGSLYGLDDFGNAHMDWKRLVLPAVALGIRPVAMICQMARASLIDALQEPFTTTARASGLTKNRVLLRHVFPNALNPVITTLSGWMASLLTGAFFVEYVFNFRGLGDLTIQALGQFDVPLVLGCCVVTVTIFIMVNTMVDILYAMSDPRIKI